MHKRYIKAFILIAALAVIAGSLAVLYLNKEGADEQNSSKSGVKGKVTDVVQKPNQAEDGYYGITVQDDSGNSYKVNATGYLNSALPPDEFDEACVDVPKVSVGDAVEFSLPKDKYQSDTYAICYKKDQKGYFFKQM